jgi:hypothetical protein
VPEADRRFYAAAYARPGGMRAGFGVFHAGHPEVGSGLVVMFGLLAGRRLDAWTALFLASTVATSVTGFGFPFHHLLPSHKVGIVSLVVLAVAILARYPLHLAGAWS